MKKSESGRSGPDKGNTEVKKETSTQTKIRLLCNPTGMYNLANSYGDVVTLSPELTRQMLDAGDAEIVK